LEPHLDNVRLPGGDEQHQEMLGLGMLIHDVARLTKRRFEETARRHGLTLPQWRVIRQLRKMGSLSQATLAAQIDSDPMTVSRMAERLEAAGLVQRIADPEDSRAKLVRLTPAAEAMYDDMRQVGLSVYEEALHGVSTSDRAALRRGLKKMTDNLGAERAEKKEV
jgi:MarR family transcriptional regulator, transcriptional regulator for hemolysin